MTNGWIDIKNTDMMLIMGGNPAENHPCGFKWPIEAKRNRNAKMIVVDPRFTRTAAVADMFLQIRAGADTAFLGGLINYALQNERYSKDYLVNYTNAAFIVKDGFKLPEDGLFSGFNPATQTYDKSTWNYEQGGNMTGQGQSEAPKVAALGGEGGRDNTPGSARLQPVAFTQQAVAPPPAAAQKPAAAAAAAPTGTSPAAPAPPPAPPPTLPPNVAYDLSLQHPRCVFQLLKKQYSRYTPEMVSRITGVPQDQFIKAAEMFTSIRKGGDMKKAGTII